MLLEIHLNAMENTKEVKITPPEGWEIDVEKSNLKECMIVYKEKKKDAFADVLGKVNGDAGIYFSDLPEGLVDKIEALGKLAIVAEYVNEPSCIKSHSIFINHEGYITISRCIDTIMFASREAAQRAICILGEDVIRIACQ